VGAFSHKFSIAPSGETTDRIKKVRGMQKWDEPLLSTMPSMMEIVGRAPAVDEKCDFFVCLSVFLSRFGTTKFVITETLYEAVLF